MKFPILVPGEFVWRDNRFVAAVRVGENLTHAHIANSGRLTDILQPGCRIWLSKVEKKDRRTPYDLILAENNSELVSIDSRVPNLFSKKPFII